MVLSQRGGLLSQCDPKTLEMGPELVGVVVGVGPRVIGCVPVGVTGALTVGVAIHH